MSEPMDLELQIQLDIKGVFDDLFEQDDVIEEDEEEMIAPTDAAMDKVGTEPKSTLTKRKLEQALASLSADLLPSSPSDPSSFKRSRFETSAPSPSSSPSRPKSLKSFQPFSSTAFYSRLSTFHLPTFTASLFPASSAATCGWINKGRERLLCEECKGAWVVPDTKGLNGKAVERLKARVQKELLDGHKAGCPWRLTQSDLSLFSDPSANPSATSLLAQASSISALLPDPDSLNLSHTLSEADLSILRSLLSSTSSPSSPLLPSPTWPSLAAFILSFFNWQLLSSSPSTSSKSSTNDPSSIPTCTIPPTQQSTLPSSSTQLILTCTSCSRRLGLWAFLPTSSSQSSSTSPPPPSSRPLNPQTEHLPTCPFRLDSTSQARLETLARLVGTRGQHVSQNDKDRGGAADGGGDFVNQIDKQSIRITIQSLLGPNLSTAEYRTLRADLKRFESGLTAAASLSLSSSAPSVAPHRHHPSAS